MEKNHEEELYKAMTILYNKCLQENADYKQLIGEAVSIGMNYQEEKIKAGINVVFSELHAK